MTAARWLVPLSLPPSHKIISGHYNIIVAEISEKELRMFRGQSGRGREGESERERGRGWEWGVMG